MSDNSAMQLSLYPISASQVPKHEMTSLTSNRAVFAAMTVDLSAAKVAVVQSNLTPFSIYVFADVVQIPRGFHWSLVGQSLFIAAREIRVLDAPAATSDDETVVPNQTTQFNLDFSLSELTTLVCYANQLTGTFQVVGAAAGSVLGKISVTELSPQGVRIGKRNGVLGTQALNGVPNELLIEGAPLLANLQTIFLHASTFFDSDQALAISMFEWIAQATMRAPSALDLRQQSISMLALLRSDSGPAAFVPFLSASIYGDVAQAYIAEAKDFETQYQRFSDRTASVQDRIQAGQLMLSKAQDDSLFAKALLSQAQQDMASSQATLDAAKDNLRTQKEIVEKARNDFDVGIDKYKREAAFKAAFEILKAIGTFGIAIGAMLLGDEAAAGSAVSGVKEAEEGVQEAIKVAEEASAMAKIAEKLNTVMGDLKKIGKAIEALANLGVSLQKSTGELSGADSLADSVTKVGVDAEGIKLDGSQAWEIFRVQIKDAMQTAIDKGIEGAANYLQQQIILTIYGQGLVAAQTACFSKAQELFRMQQQQLLAKQKQDRDQQYLKALESQEADLTPILQAFYERYLNVKRYLFVALQNYRMSYRYFALRESAIQPRLSDRIDTLASGLSDITKLKLDNAEALVAFRASPQQLQGATIEIRDPGVLHDLRTTRKTRFIVSSDDEVFEKNDRVRTSKVMVYVAGLKPSSKEKHLIGITVQSSGHYRDRLNGESFQFTAAPFTRRVEYSLVTTSSQTMSFDNGETIYVQASGELANFVQFAYFEPTPFTEWQIRLDDSLDADLSKITAIYIIFSGSFIPDLTNR